MKTALESRAYRLATMPPIRKKPRSRSRGTGAFEFPERYPAYFPAFRFATSAITWSEMFFGQAA